MNEKSFFQELGNTSPYFKLAFQGSAGSGKTYTAGLIAVGLHKRIGSDKPVVIFDTERSAKFLRRMFGEAGIKVLVKESRTLPDLVETIKWCDQGGADVLLVDSITHVYEGFLADYRLKKKRDRLQFQDWGWLKPEWKRQFSDRLVMANCHIIFTGREGYTYEYEEIDGKKELVKTGVRMKAEGETAYEPDLLIRMNRFESVVDPTKVPETWHEGTVLKDRSDLIDGQVIKNPTYDHLSPVIEALFADPTRPAPTVSHPNEDMIPDDNEDAKQAKTEHQILIERIGACMEKIGAYGTGRDAKQLRTGLLEYSFHGETSETAIEQMSLDELRHGLERLQTMCRLIYDITKVEGSVYGAPKAIDAARGKYLGVDCLGQSQPDKLELYKAHLAEKHAAMVKEADEGLPFPADEEGQK